jgi:hypothetical protein
VYGVNDVGDSEIHIVEQLVLKLIYFEVEIAIDKLKMYKSPGTGQIVAELIQAGGILYSKIHNLINLLMWNLILIIFKCSVPASMKTQYFSITKINWLVLLRK